MRTALIENYRALYNYYVSWLNCVLDIAKLFILN